MAVLRVTNFVGLLPKLAARAPGADFAQTASNIMPTTVEFRPLGADTTVVGNSGVTNPLSIYRLARKADGSFATDFSIGWIATAADRNYVKTPLNDNAKEWTYVTYNDGSQAPRVIDVDGGDRQLGVPAPTTAPTIVVNVVDEFTSEDRAGALQSALAVAKAAVVAAATLVWRGAADPGTGTTGYMNRTTANGFNPVDPSQQVRVYRLGSAGSAISDSYTTVDASYFSWVFDPAVGAVTGAATASTPAWAGAAGTAHICVPFTAYGITYDLDGAALTTALEAIPMPGLDDGTKLFTSDQVDEIVAELEGYVDPAGAVIKPKIDALAAKVLEAKTLLDGGGRSSIAASVEDFYDIPAVDAQIDAAIDSWANFVFNKADDIARSSLDNDYLIGAQP